ncbi:MAG: amidohydrolase family protein [Deltaproteobacteria bacterium]|nr:amidohydrolase family protein [Deltaproteobacteria bacterium]
MDPLHALAWLSLLTAANACHDGPMTDSASDASGDDSGGDTDSDGSHDAGRVLECAAHPLPDAAGSCIVERAGTAGTILRGTVLDGEGVLRGGEVFIDSSGTIACVDCDCSGATGAASARVLQCGDAVISPGLVNPHDHITYANNAPIGQGVDRYEHRHDWRKGQNGHASLHTNSGASANEVLGAELRFVMGGATAAASAGGEAALLRNLDTFGLSEGLSLPVADSDTFPLDDASGEQRELGCDYGSSPTSRASIQGHAYLPHIAEGINPAAANEFTCTGSAAGEDLMGPQTAVIHGVGLRPPDIAAMVDAGAMLVWSPRSNVVLYGNTAPVTTMRAMGLPIALGTDWVASGSMNMQRELQCADTLDRDYFGDAFGDRELWQMATEHAARAVGAGEVLGVLAAGRVGDVAVFRGDAHLDHRAVIDAAPDDVVLVMRGGVPLFGDDGLLTEGFSGGSMCETLDVCGVAKRACVARDTQGVATLADVRAAIEASYPLFFCDTPDDEPTCEPRRAGEYEGRPDGDRDGDGIADGDDLCPGVFDPVRPLDGGPADADGDGIGDACDPCPLAEGDAC